MHKVEKSGTFVGTGGGGTPGWTLAVSTRVTDTPFVLEFLDN